jgi:TP901 family phage tail tape measure protein
MGMSGAVNLGSAYGDFLVDTSGVEASLNKAFQTVERTAESAFARVGSHIQKAGDKLASWGGTLTKLTAPITLMGAAGIKAFASFDEALTEIKARTGATADEMEKVKKVALEMGKSTKYSATEASEGMLQLLASGYDLTQTFEALPAVLNAAAAGNMDLGFTADAVTDVLAMFNLEAKDAAMVADVLAKASAASSAEINDLAQGFGNVGPIAAQFGLSVEETAAILAIFAENGVKGAEAGTQLKSMLTHLSSPTKEVQKTWAKLGLSLFDAYGAVKPIPQVLGELSAKLATMTDKERIQTTQALAGSFGQIGATILTSNMSIEEMVALMDQQAGAAEVARARMSSLNGMVKQLKNSIETTLITALGPLIDNYLKPGIARVTELVNKLTDWINTNPKLTSQIVSFLAVLAAVGPTLFGIGKAVSLVGMLIGGLASPIGWIALAVAGLALAWQTNFLGIQNVVKKVVGKVTDIIQNDLMSEIRAIWDGLKGGDPKAVLKGVSELFAAIITIVTGGGSQMRQRVTGIFAGFTSAFRPVLDGFTKIGQVIRVLINEFSRGGLSQVFRTFFGGTMIQDIATSFGLGESAARSLGDSVRGLFTSLGPIIESAKTFILSAFTAIAGFIVNEVVPVFQMFVGWLVGEFAPALINVITKNLLPLYKSFFNFLAAAWEIVKPGLTELWKWFVKDGLPGILKFISKTVIPAYGEFIDLIRSVWEKAAPFLLKLLDWFVNTGMPVIIRFIRNTVIPAVGAFINKVVSIWNTVSPWLQRLYTWFVVTGFPAIKNYIYNTMIPALVKVWHTIRDMWNYAYPYLKKLYSWFTESAFPGMKNFIYEKFLPAVYTLQNTVKGVWDAVYPKLKSMYDWFVTNGLPWIKTAINDLKTAGDNLASGLAGIWDRVYPKFVDMYNWINDKFVWLKDNVIGPLIDKIQGAIDIYNRAKGLLGSLNPGNLFQTGGWTGNMPSSRIAGAVHGQEWVIPTPGGPLMLPGALTAALATLGQSMDSLVRSVAPAPALAPSTNTVNNRQVSMPIYVTIDPATALTHPNLGQDIATQIKAAMTALGGGVSVG